MSKTYTYIVVKDQRTRKLYLDFSDSMMRSFETIEDRGNNKDSILKKYPDISDLTRESKSSLCR